MTAYSVSAKRWAHSWELYIHDADGNEVGVTQSVTLDDADLMVRDYVAVLTGADPGSLDVTINPELTVHVRRSAEVVGP